MVVMRDMAVHQRDSTTTWSPTSWPLTTSAALLDATRGADGQTHLLMHKGYHGVFVLTPTP